MLCHRARMALSRAISRDHYCSSLSCPIYIANVYGWAVTSARFLLDSADSSGLIHVPHWCDSYGLQIPKTLEECEDWRYWDEYATRNGKPCEYCDTTVYGDEFTRWNLVICPNCGHSVISVDLVNQVHVNPGFFINDSYSFLDDLYTITERR